MFHSQNNNEVGRNLVGRDMYETNNYHVPKKSSPLEKLYQKLKTENEGDVLAQEIAEKLQHFCTKLTSGDVRGLEEKLKSAGRDDLLFAAKMLKEEAAKLIMRTQTSPTAQTILTHILCNLYVSYISFVQPAIQAGKSRIEIDGIIYDKVLMPADEMLGENDLNITNTELFGFVYYLGGNCHIRWDK